MGRAAEPQELDVHALLRLFLSKVENGRPATFATFREAWQELRFSFIYEGCKERVLSQEYISWLLAAACDHFWAPLPEGPGTAKPADKDGTHALLSLDISSSAEAAQLHLVWNGRADVDATQRPLAIIPEGVGQDEPSRAEHTQHVPDNRSDCAVNASSRPIQAAAHGLSSEVIDDLAAGSSHTSAVVQPQTAPLDESSLLALLMDNDDIDALEPDRHILEALKNPMGTGAITPVGEDTNDKPSFALMAGALYTIYTIHKTQPAYKGRRVRAYIPVSSLQVISGMLPEARQKQIPDVPAIVKCLVNEQAIVVGGVCRPPAGHQIVRDAPVRMAQVDMSERNKMQPMTMRHLANTQLALRELKHVQLLCDSYSKAQHSVFDAADPEGMPPSIADLGMGEHFRDLARQTTVNIHAVLSGDAANESRRQKRADQKAAQEGAEEATLLEGDAKTARRKPANKAPQDLQAELSEVDLGGLPSMAKAVELKRIREQADILARQRAWAERGARALAAAEDMPDDEGHPARLVDTSAKGPRAGSAAAADSAHMSSDAHEAGADWQTSQHGEENEPALRPAQDHSKGLSQNGLHKSTRQPQYENEYGEESARGRAATRAIADVFGENSSSDSEDLDHHDEGAQHAHVQSQSPAQSPSKAKADARADKAKAEELQLHEEDAREVSEHLEQSAEMPVEGSGSFRCGRNKDGSRLDDGMEHELAMEDKKHSTRSVSSRGAEEPHEAAIISRAKRKAGIPEQPADISGAAGLERKSASKASGASDRSKKAKGDQHHNASKGKPVAAEVSSQEEFKSHNKLDQIVADPVDWKSYADALDMRMAEADALLADDSN